MRKVRYALIAIAVIISMITAGKGAAQATPADQLNTQVCVAIKNQPTADGVMGIAMAMLDAGATSREAALLIYYAVQQNCPEENPVLDEFMAVYG